MSEQKLRFDLTPPFASQKMAEVFGQGAEANGDRAWENGRKWSEVLAKIERNLIACKAGKDYDPESGMLYAAQLMAQAAILTEYYKIYPQGDDRRHLYLNPPKIGLDIDEVLADWIGAWTERHGMQDPVLFWNFDRDIKEKFQKMKDDKDFWLSVKPKIDPRELPFEPHCYITSRSIPVEWTEQWLQKHNFPAVPVYCVPFNQSKIEVAKQSGIDWFVDDRYENFVELNNAGICTFLLDCEHNRRYDVGFKRIYSLNDIKL